MFPYKNFFLLCLLYSCICQASATPIFNNWKEDFSTTRGEIFKPSGEAPPRITFLNLVHFRQLVEDHPGIEKRDNFDQLISIAELKVENCNREKFSVIENLTWWYSSDKRTNVELYLDYIREKMLEICDDAFEKGHLSERIFFQHDVQQK